MEKWKKIKKQCRNFQNFWKDTCSGRSGKNTGFRKEKSKKELAFEKTGNKFYCSVPEFYMDKGINKYSAVLRGKKREDEQSKNGFYIRFVPRSSDEFLNIEMMVKPL